MSIEDLMDTLCAIQHKCFSYCVVAFHFSLTVDQATDVERLQKMGLKILLGDRYVRYPAALKICNLQTFPDHRGKRCLDLAIKFLRHPGNKEIFPLNKTLTKI